uniref:Protein cornichon n=1 Tax=Parastrongyloides trichosuri TaxID=131310 RepID=A0A0N4Z8F1_PARTI
MAFTFVAFAYLIGMLAVGFGIFMAIMIVISIDELKTDYKNPIDQCRSLNSLVLPEYAVQGGVTFLFLITLQWFAILWNAPLLAYHVNRYLTRPRMSTPGIYDPTTIMRANELRLAYREGWIKLGFYLISFFYYLYALIYTMVTSS